MAKRKIEREVVVDAPSVPVPTDVSGQDQKPMEAKIILQTGVASILSVRVVGLQVLFNDGLHMVRLPIVKGKPLMVTLKQ